MTHKNALRPAMTALAAVLALSSVPSFAQSASEPAVTTTPAVDVTPAPAAADPIAPADTAVATDPVVTRTTTTTARKTMTTSKTAVAHPRPAPARSTHTVRSIAPAAPAAAIAAPVAQAPVAQPPLVQTQPTQPVAAAPAPAAPIAKAPATTIDVLPTAALGGLGLLALLGGGLFLRSRRRRRLEEIEDAEWQQQAVAEPEGLIEAEPAAVAEPVVIEPQPDLTPALTEPAFVAAAIPAATQDVEAEPKFIGPETDLPDNFDLSRFGPNVQEAYRGPTEDNPSASLKQRLRRAHGMDQQERKLDAEVEAATGESVLGDDDEAPAAAAPAAQPTPVQPAKSDFIFARGNHKQGSSPVVDPLKVN